MYVHADIAMVAYANTQNTQENMTKHTQKKKRMTLELFHRLNWQDSKVVPYLSSSRLGGQSTTHLTMV